MIKVNVEDYIKVLKSKLGNGYVYGTVSEICTIKTLERCQSLYGKKMGEGYFQLNGDYTKGKCARWLGHRVHDCSGLIESSYNELTGLKTDYSAQGFYDICTTKVKLSELVRGDALFRADKSGHIVHVGYYLGNDTCIESQGVMHGVVERISSKRGWTHAGKLPFIDYGIVKDEIDELLDKLIELNVITDRKLWDDYIRNKKTILPTHIKYLISSGISKLRKISDDERLICEAKSLMILSDNKYWLDVVTGTTQTNGQTLKYLCEKIGEQVGGT